MQAAQLLPACLPSILVPTPAPTPTLLATTAIMLHPRRRTGGVAE